MIQLNEKYNREDYLDFLKNDFLTDFSKDVRPVNTNGLSSIKKAEYLGESKDLNLQVFEFLFEGSSNKRITLTKDAFSVMKSHATFRTLAIFHSADNKDWRFSLMTATPEPTEKGKVLLSYSNPKRLSFFLGPNAKINTPTKFLINKGKIVDFEDLKNRFSIEVVNKEFYKEISQAFTKLVNGLLKLPSTQDKSQTNLEFAVRLIGRVIFCWFLREKKSQAGMALMPKELLSLEAVKENEDYYHKILEPIFFEILNKTVKSRRDDFTKEPFSFVPYLNGGLFSPQEDDYYKRTNGDLQSQYHNTLVIPDHWLKDFFEILETYNFTIDENTSYDEELSIDPEMLGRIFENLLAEINPETGESARKSTGSYYTPRVIVNYMIDESLLLYLKEQTGISEEKLRAIISYDLDDDLENPVTVEEKEKIIDALEKVKILDPACGSGAFPIGALQKIVFILQQTDPEGQLWFKKQIQNTSPEIRRVVEREFSHKNFDYIRKLGIIRENIYGVDIQSIATEISRLRCFLTLIVDERIQDEAENRGIEPLPNLDFKFVTANSLIGLPKIDLSQQSFFDDYQKIDDLKDIRDQYFNASGLEREQLKTEFVMAQKKLVDQLIKEHGFMGVAKAELTQKLTDWEPFTHKPTNWFDPEWMFGIKDGFDIVIANPPYDVYQGEKKAEIDIIKRLEIYNISRGGKLNAYKLFLARSTQLQRDKGILCEIFQNSFLGDNSARLLRKYFLDNQRIIQIDSFPERDNHQKRVFPGVKMSVCILLSIKTINNDNEFSLSVWDDRYMSCGYKTLFSSREIKLSSPDEFVIPMIKEEEKLPYFHLKKLGNKFGAIAECYRGELNMTTERKYFTSIPNKYMALKGAQIQRFFITNDPSQGVIEYVLKDKYLQERRGDKSQHFQVARIVFQRITGVNDRLRLKAALSNAGSFCADSCNYAIPKKGVSLYLLLALLNSNLLNWFFKKTSTNSNVNGYEIGNLPVIINNVLVNPIDEMVKKILAITTSLDYLGNPSKKEEVKEYEKQIDQIIYKLYDLTSEEIGIIE